MLVQMVDTFGNLEWDVDSIAFHQLQSMDIHLVVTMPDTWECDEVFYSKLERAICVTYERHSYSVDVDDEQKTIHVQARISSANFPSVPALQQQTSDHLTVILQAAEAMVLSCSRVIEE